MARTGRVLLDLAAKARHEDPEVMCLAQLVRTPDLFEQVRVGQYLASVFDERAEQLVLQRGELHFRSAGEYAAGCQVHFQVAGLEYSRFLIARHAAGVPQRDADARE